VTISVGIALNEHLLTADGAERRRLVERVTDVGLDHVTIGDHISFHGGTGFDGVVSATSLLSTNDNLRVVMGIYLLGLRHPMASARAFSTLCEIAPGRLVLGVGVGGEDRSEISNAGVDPSTRGRRLDETIAVFQRLLSGEEVDHVGEFFTLEKARILPTPTARIPLVIGGGGDAAVNRTAKYGDGWLGIFCSSRRFAETVERVRSATSDLGRPPPSWFGLNVWCGLGTDSGRAKKMLGARMHSLYNLPYDKFQHVTSAGTPEQVAERLSDYVGGGAQHLTIVPVAESVDESIDMVAEVRRLLVAEHAPTRVSVG
jgi:alkanesulfonate monooxygenase SsuD/methylene tetrahydromethanopterin reductase-like flavin-dependent oxidoreductase (luciferase family)